MDKISQTVNLFDYNISNAGLENDISRTFSFIDNGDMGHFMACANPHSLVEAEKDIVFSEALKNADILLPDGVGIIIAGKILGLPFKERVAGNEFFMEFCDRANKKKIKYYFLGSTENVLTKIKKRLKKEYPNIEVVGTYSPPFKEELSDFDNMKIIKSVNDSQPDVLWVGMTAPKQEKWIYKNINELNVPFAGAIGAVFDFYAETKYRAPDWVCSLGLEWLPRLLREPRRLWKRNLISTPIFLVRVFLERLKLNSSN